MSLETPDLDIRNYKELVKEARARIPRYTPEWTNLNDSDPGMGLVKLNAWLTETILYQLNRLPELNYIKFLELLNIKQKHATAARTELTFTLKKLNSNIDPLSVLIPKNAQVAVDDPELSQEVVFETDYTLTAINAAIGALLIKTDNNDSGLDLELITEYDSKEAGLKISHAFYPFSSSPGIGDICLIGIFLRPHRKKDKDNDYYSQDVFPAGPLDLTVHVTEVFEEDDQDEIITGPFAKQSIFPWELAEQTAMLEWEVYVSTDHTGNNFENVSGNQDCWQRLNLHTDETGGLQSSGHVRPEIPDNISSISFHKLSRNVWESAGLKKPPGSIDQLITDLQDTGIDLIADMLDEDLWQEMGVDESQLPHVLSCCSDVTSVVAFLNDPKDENGASLDLDPSQISFENWIKLEAGYDDPAVPSQAMVWLRVRVLDAGLKPALLNTFLLNTVPATAAVTRLEEQLGSSDGRPGQKLTLTRTPVYYDSQLQQPDLELEVVESGESRSWTRVADFYRQEADSEVFVLDETSGVITFGDGVYGRIPIAGAQIIARRYRYGGGAQSNAGEHSISKLKSVIPSIDSVTNIRAAEGGMNAESLTETKLRAAHDMKSRDRAVSAEDFALLAKETPDVAIQRAYAIARRKINDAQQLIESDGSVTVVILPFNDEETPQPSEAQLEAVCEHLNPRRLITTELYVTGPRYKKIKSLQAEMRVRSDADLKEVTDAGFTDLLQYFHPLTGGEDGIGWPFGDDIYLGNVYQRLLSLDGVRRVVSLDITMADGSNSTCSDSIAIPEGHLIHLPRDVIKLKVVYDNYR